MEPVSGAWACMESGGRCWGQVVGTHGVAIGLVSRASTVLGGGGSPGTKAAQQQLLLVEKSQQCLTPWGVCGNVGCWLLQWQKLTVSSTEQAAGVHTNKHYGVLCS